MLERTWGSSQDDYKYAMCNLEVVECRYFDPVGKFPYWIMYRVLKKKTLGSSAVGLYDKVIVPLSAILPVWLVRRLGGKNLVLIARLVPK